MRAKLADAVDVACLAHAMILGTIDNVEAFPAAAALTEVSAAAIVTSAVGAAGLMANANDERDRGTFWVRTDAGKRYRVEVREVRGCEPFVERDETHDVRRFICDCGWTGIWARDAAELDRIGGEPARAHVAGGGR